MDKVEELLTRGVSEILPTNDELKKLLKSGKKLRVYMGFDPTSPQLHIGHLVGLRKLKQWQELGHEVIFLIGDFTARIGDPSGKNETRPKLEKEVVEENAKEYKKQAGKILKFDGDNPVKIRFNSEWLDPMTAYNFVSLASETTFVQIIERDMFQKRIKTGKNLSLQEILYPLIQGYDSVAMDVDVEVGGHDQLFNMMMGRHLMRKLKGKDKFVMTLPLLTDKEGNKIGKTSGNAVALTDTPTMIFGDIMSIPDNVIYDSLLCMTDISIEKKESINKAMIQGENPVQFKKLLAFEVVKQLHGEEAAKKAQEDFENTFSKGQIPQDVPTIKIKEASVELVDFLVDNNLAPSKSEAKR
ncbi:MAG TPA: tyrosine--tRNA ligase, partial [Candidatus Saccharimonadales bacterium]|nr:tyrosine--tRNA ligase [Candidatus Saccharimonadales bacterium]